MIKNERCVERSAENSEFSRHRGHSLQIVVLMAQLVRSLPDTLERAAVVGRERRSDKLKEKRTLAAYNASRGDLFRIGKVRQKNERDENDHCRWKA